MRSFVSAGLVAALLAGISAVPASAFPINPITTAGTADLVKVQFQGGNGIHPHGGGGGGGHGGGNFHQGGGGHGGGFGGGHGGGFHGGHGFGGGGRGYGVGIGAGIAGLAAGAIIGGAIANQGQPYYGDGYGYPAPVYAQPADEGYEGPPPGGDDQEAYCASTYRSYDPRSGTFLGNDGMRHPCP